MNPAWSDRRPDPDIPSAEALLGQFAARLQDALVDMREAATPTIIVQRATREVLPAEPLVVRVAHLVAGTFEAPAVLQYDDSGLPLLRAFPKGPIGRLQQHFIDRPGVYKVARRCYRIWSRGKQHVGSTSDYNA